MMAETCQSFPIDTAPAAAEGRRARLAARLADAAPGFDPESAALLLRHGIRPAREHLYALSVRVPAGRLAPAQYLALDDIADRYGDGALGLAARQGIELGGLLKRDLKEAIGALALARLTTLGTGGATARAVTALAPGRDPVQRRLEAEARRLSQHLLPPAGAYEEIWLDGAPSADDAAPDDLPHKLEIGLALVEDDAIDVLAHDLALLARAERDEIVGYTVALGGAGDARRAVPIAFVAPADLVGVVQAAVTLFRSHGDRAQGRRALAHLVATRGAGWIKAQLEAALGRILASAPAQPAPRRREHLGWHEQGDGRFYLGLAVPGARIADAPGLRLRAALRLACRSFGASVLLAPARAVILGDIAPSDRRALTAALGHLAPAPADPLPAWREAS